MIPGQVDDDLYNEHLSRYLFAKRYLRGKVVLGAGCGVGYGLYEVRKVAKKIYGIDISRGSIGYAKKKYPSKNIHFEIGDVEKPRFKDNFFDVILSFEVIEHLSRQDVYLKEMKRVLKKKGLFFVSTPNKIYYSKERQEKNPFHIKEFDLKEFREILSKQFKYVSIYSQNHNTAISISPQKQGTSTADIETREASRISPSMDNYFIAICSNAPISETMRKDFIYLPHKGNLLYERTKWALSLDKELNQARKYISKVQKEFDEKALFANRLNEELAVANEYTRKRQKEFDEKALWANRLNKELARLNELNAELGYELSELKKSLFFKVHLSFLSALNNIRRLLAKNRIVNSAASTAFLIAYFIFKKISVPFNLSKAKNIAGKIIPTEIDPPLSGKKLNILFVTAMLPSKMHGGGVVMFNLIKELSKSNNISLISFIDFKAERKYIRALRPYVKKIKIFERWAQRMVLLGGKYLIPDGIRSEFYCPEMAEEISEELKRKKYDILQFEYLQMAIYKGLCRIPKRTKVLITDLETIYKAFRQRIKLFPPGIFWSDFKEYLRLFHYETSVLKHFSKVFVFTEHDALNLLEYSPNMNIAVHSLGVDFDYFSKKLARERFPSLVFLGNYEHPPNREAVIYFGKKIFPRIKLKYPNIKFYVVGHMPRKDILMLARSDKNIIVTNTVEDVRPYIQRASVFVAPLKSGEGQRIKILEAMASKAAIVSTPLGCRGIEAEDGKHLLIAKNDGEFAEDILLLLKNAQLRRDLGSNACELAKKYDWKIIARQRLNVYLQLLKQGRE